MIQLIKNKEEYKEFGNEDYYQDYIHGIKERIVTDYRIKYKKPKSNAGIVKLFYENSDFKRLTNRQYCRVIKQFFSLILIEILNGFEFSTPIGKFLLVKKYNRPGVRSTDFAATKAAGYTVFRDKDYYFKYTWIKSRMLPDTIKHFRFRVPSYIKNQINKHEEQLEDNVTKIYKF